MAKPHLYPNIPGLHSQTQIYTQRRASAEAPANFKFTVDQLAMFLAINYNFGPAPVINPNPISYTPAASGNTENLSEFVEDPSGALWFIDYNGLAITFEGLGVIYWNESLLNSGIHEGRNVGHWTPNAPTAAADAVIQPKGIGAFALSIDGNKRGQRAVDLQMERDNNNQVASGPNSTIIGGRYNRATGTLSGAAGYRAKALHNGSWVIADDQDQDHESENEKEIRFRFLNRVHFATNLVQTNGDIEITDFQSGIILRDANGDRHRVTIGSDSNLIAKKIT